MKANLLMSFAAATLAAVLTLIFTDNWPQPIAGAASPAAFPVQQPGSIPRLQPLSQAGLGGSDTRSTVAPATELEWRNANGELPLRKFTAEEQINISVYENVNRSVVNIDTKSRRCLLYTSPSPRDRG